MLIVDLIFVVCVGTERCLGEDKMKDDLISRNAACDKMMELYNEDLEAYCVPISESFDAERTVEAINELPSAQPGPKKGEWIRMSDADGIFYACSECGEWNKETIDFCPNCGVEMRKREYPCYSPHDGSQLFTNADRIRSMTDEELAKFFTPEEYDGRPIFFCPSKPEGRCVTSDCRECFLKWLKQEVDDDGRT